MEFKNSVDIIKTATRMLPVTDYNDLVSKLDPYKNASANLIIELVRAVNTEGQYQALKTSEFKLSKAASSLKAPFDPSEVLRLMSKKEVGTVKAAEFTGFKFKDIRKQRNTVKKTASMNAEALIKKLASSSVESDKEKYNMLRNQAIARKQALQSDLKYIGKQIAELISSEPIIRRKYAELSEFAGVRPSVPQKLSLSGVLKWAQLNDRLSELMDEMKLVDLAIGE